MLATPILIIASHPHFFFGRGGGTMFVLEGLGRRLLKWPTDCSVLMAQNF